MEEKYRDINSIFQILNSYADGEVNLEDILVKLVVKNVSSSDLLFLILQKLERDGYISGVKGVVKILKRIDEKEVKEVTNEVADEIRRNRKLFLTPLEVGKFYMCPRRLFLEKIVLSREHKERRGRTWDGEVVHLAINLFVKNLMKKELKELVEEVSEVALKRYEGRTNLTKEKLKDFILKFYHLIEEEKFKRIFAERTFESFRVGVVGTPDVVGLKENGDITTIDIKLGRLSRRGVKEEHLLQIIGEAILVEDFFRRKVKYCYLIYFGSNSLVKVNIDSRMRRKFIGYKKRAERVSKSKYIPEKSRLKNFRVRVCKGCHVKAACDNIEAMRRIH